MLRKQYSSKSIDCSNVLWSVFSFTSFTIGAPYGVMTSICLSHTDVIKWKHFPRCWPFVRGIHQWPVNSPHKCQWRGALMFSFICAWINRWANNREAGEMRCRRAHYDVIVMQGSTNLVAVSHSRYQCVPNCNETPKESFQHYSR